MLISPRNHRSATMPRTMLGRELIAARALPRSVRRPQLPAEPNPMRAVNPRRAARSRSRVPTPPPIASHPRAAPSDRDSQVAADGVSRDRLSSEAMVRRLAASVNPGLILTLESCFEDHLGRCRHPLTAVESDVRSDAEFAFSHAHPASASALHAYAQTLFWVRS